MKTFTVLFISLLTWNMMLAQTVVSQKNTSIVTKKSKAAKGEKCQLKKPSTHFSNQKLKGIIKDENGEPLIAATVLLEKSKGTITDMDGKFELDIPQDWESFEVTFSYLGYETQVIEFDKTELEKGKMAEVKMETSSVKLKTLECIGKRVIPVEKVIVCGYFMSQDCLVFDEQGKKKEETKPPSISSSNIFPNPFVDFITIKLQVEKEALYSFYLYNTNGQIIWTRKFDLAKGKQELRLDFSTVKMAQGNHFLRITNGNQEIQTQKIIKVNSKNEKAKTTIPSLFQN